MTATIAAAAAVVSLARTYRNLPLSWQVLGYSGVPLALGGIGFVLRFWHPTEGPYVANRVHPFGSHLNAWAVSFGFMWLSFGVLFMIAVLQTARAGTMKAWCLLLTCWLLAWLPHGVIGVAFARSGANRESVDLYGRWSHNPSGAVTLVSSALVMMLHFGLSVFGFVAAGLRVV